MELSSAASRYEDFYIIEKGLSTNTYLGYKNDLNLFFVHLQDQGVTQTQEIRFDHILGFLSRRSPKVTSTTLNREKSVIKNFLLYCLALGEVTEDFSELLTSETKEDFLPSILTQEEMSQLFQHIENKKQESSSYQYYLAERDHLMLEILYALGLRVSELIGIRLGDIDREGWCRIRGKGDKVRTVPLFPRTEKRIAFYLQEIRPRFLSSLSHEGSSQIKNIVKSQSKWGEDHLFLNKNGKKLSRIAVWKWVKGLSYASGINKNIYPHTFRHTCATHLLQSGADLRVIQELVGHSNIQTTELYTHLITEDVKQTFAEYHPLCQG